MTSPRTFSPRAALAVVIANMIGTGVFTSLGYQVVDIKSGFAIMVLWTLGGIAALCGALCYAELGAAFPRSGGEYNFLSRIFHPAAGFIAGWISATVGFAAPIALVSLAFAAYLTPASAADTKIIERLIAGSLIISLAIMHSGRRTASAGSQIMFTGFKIAVILVFCALSLIWVSDIQRVDFSPSFTAFEQASSGAFAVSLIFVGYAYTGWNAATYLTGELDAPQRDLPRILIFGTAIVTALYLLLNAVFLLVAPMSALEGVEEIGRVAAEYAFGPAAGSVVGFVFAALLVSTVSAMTVAGPRVLQVIGEDTPALKALSKANEDGIPYRAVWTQTLIALGFISIATFEQVLVFTGFTLSLVSLLTVVGVIYLRWAEPNLQRPFRIPLFPMPPLIFIAIIGWTLWYTIGARPTEALFAAALILSGAAIYAVLKRAEKIKT